MSTQSSERPRRTALARLVEAIFRLGPVYSLANLVSARRFVVEGDSMEPALAPGHYLLISRMAYRLTAPARGDIVVVRDHHGGDREYIKRIVGLPGERVRIEGGQPFVNDQPLEEPYLERRGPWLSRRDGEWRLGTGERFVLGDNRNDSRDSRTFGPVPFHRIVGKAWVCYWPRNAWGRVRHGHSR